MKKRFLIDEFENGLSSEIKRVLIECSKVAEDNGFNIYLIGGAVRDLLLGKEVINVDVVVEGDAIEFADIIAREPNSEIIHKQTELRTAKVLFQNGIDIDFASTRIEDYPVKGELPKITKIGCTLKEDVLRRDFTVNTMAIGLNSSNWCEFIDYLDGYRDLVSGKIRVLHDKSFIDDPSRIIRGLKFAVRFGFSLDDKTFELQELYLAKVNKEMPLERIRGEIQQLFSLNSVEAFDKFVSQKLYRLLNIEKTRTVGGKRVNDAVCVFNIPQKDVWLLYLGCILVDESQEKLQKLNLDSKQINILLGAKELLTEGIAADSDKYSIYKFFNEKDLISLGIYYIFTQDKNVFVYLNELKDIKLSISGEDLIFLGLEPSPRFKELMDKVLKEKINNSLLTKEDELSYLKTLL